MEIPHWLYLAIKKLLTVEANVFEGKKILITYKQLSLHISRASIFLMTISWVRDRSDASDGSVIHANIDAWIDESLWEMSACIFNNSLVFHV